MFFNKPINTESTNYKLARGAIDIIGFAGGVFAVDTLVLPFVELLWKKNPIIRGLCYVGSWGLSLYGGSATCVAIDSAADAVVSLWNMRFEEDTEVSEDAKLDKITAAKTVDDIVAKYELFTFKSEEEAKKYVECLHGYFNNEDVPNQLSLYSSTVLNTDETFRRIHKEVSDEDARTMMMFGWTRETFKPEIEKIRDDEWMVDIHNYDVLPYCEKYFK